MHSKPWIFYKLLLISHINNLFVQALEPTEMDLAYGGEYVCYELGLPYEYKSELNVGGA
jgi:hypothetical protein